MLPMRAITTFQLLALLALPGCAMLVASSGIGSVDAIPAGLQRSQVQERFGPPVSTGTSAAGRAVEVFHIRQRIGTFAGMPADADTRGRVAGILLVCLNPIMIGLCVAQDAS